MKDKEEINMLRSITGIIGYEIQATDGEIGKVHDFYFDDRQWTIRYMVAETGNFFNSKYVLISPVSLGDADWVSKTLKVDLTKEKIKNSPTIDEHAPVSSQKESELMKYYNWPNYWMYLGANVPETAIIISKAMADKRENIEKMKNQNKSNPHLRSTIEVLSYNIQANDGDLGKVNDLIVDDEEWLIRYLIVDTKAWLPWSKKVLLSPVWIKDIDWSDQKVRVDLSKEVIKNSPEFDSQKPVNREYETRLYDYYGRPKYWLKE
jgi:sporulation protein YlmC with PRC-barrel domain